jgi:hypothetical protein
MPSSTNKNTTTQIEADVALPSIEFDTDEDWSSTTNRSDVKIYDPEKAEWGIDWGIIRQPENTPTSDGLDCMERRGSEPRPVDVDRPRDGSEKPTTD